MRRCDRFRDTVGRALTLALCLGTLVAPASVGAQLVRGRVIDSANGAPVPLAAVHLLDGDRQHVALAMADSVGRYFLSIPDSGEYRLVALRYGYIDLESPLLAISDGRDYDLDLEMRPEPIGLSGVTVTVRNEELVRWLTLELGVNPHSISGFRLLQGERLEEAKARATNEPTGTLRWLYIPIAHGRCVSINSVPTAQSVSWFRGARNGAFVNGAATPPAGTISPSGGSATSRVESEPGCGGRLLVDDRVIPNELVDTIDMKRVAVIITLPGEVRMYTYDFDWAFRSR